MTTKKTVSGIMQELNRLVEEVDGKALGPTLDKLEGILGGLTQTYQAEGIATVTQEVDKLRDPGVATEEVQKFLEMLEGLQSELSDQGDAAVAEEIGKLGAEISTATGVQLGGGESGETPESGETTEAVAEEEDEDGSEPPKKDGETHADGPGKSENSSAAHSPLGGNPSGGASVCAKPSATSAGSDESGKPGIAGVSTSYKKTTAGTKVDVVQKYGDTKTPEASFKMPKMSEERAQRLQKLQRYI